MMIIRLLEKKIQEKCIQKDNADADPFVIIFRPQCVKSPIFVQKFKLMKILLKLSFWIFVAKLTIFIGEKILNVSIFAPKLVKKMYFLKFF